MAKKDKLAKAGIHANNSKGHQVKKKSNDLKNPALEQANKKLQNPKAFAINSVGKADRGFRRKQDLDTKKQHVPLVDRATLEPPPILIAVVGPPKVGKTTLIHNLIKLFTKANVSELKGPITVVTGKKRRITLIECNNDIHSMIDLAKVADLVLLLCDASFGFEMEVFEFINICQVHGMPKIMGVLTHLDLIKSQKMLKTTKKTLKHRFWAEVYPGAKLFYLSGILHGDYLQNEVRNLGRFISVMKFRPLTWRITHSYLLADRFEDLTNRELIKNNAKCDRNVSLYGYMRGIPLNKSSALHIAGFGDVKIHKISDLPDPCPLPDQTKKRGLLGNEKLIYAPFSDVGGIVYDKDAVYVELNGSHSHHENKGSDETSNIVNKLLDNRESLSTKIDHLKLKVFADSDEIMASNFKTKMKEFENRDVFPNYAEHARENLIGNFVHAKVAEQEEQSSEQSEEFEMLKNADTEEPCDDSAIKWKQNLEETAKETFSERSNLNKNLTKIVYGPCTNKPLFDDNSNKDRNEEFGDLFRRSSTQQDQKKDNRRQEINNLETCLQLPWDAQIHNWLELREENPKVLQNFFVSGNWSKSDDAQTLLNLDDLSDNDETPEENEVMDTDDIKDRSSTLAEKKRKLKEKFDVEYDNVGPDNQSIFYDRLKSSAENQTQINKSAFDDIPESLRVQIEGFRAGMYVRIEFTQIPFEFVENFDATCPIIIGSLNPGEENIGYVNVKIKKHRWYKKILKSNDPLVISMGWRRFQTLPLYSKLEDDLKYRYLKYTPEHMACTGIFWGPSTPQSSGFLALQSAHESDDYNSKGFRIAATGIVQQLDKFPPIMKKLKLVGYPMKIYKKTAFIKGMFNSSLEVAKYEGARIKTVSGIRGQIKKAASKPEGVFRATFEDKIQLSDIVFCRTWYKVTVEHFYNPITTLLLPPENKKQWRGLKTLGTIKREARIANVSSGDSSYTEIVREPKVFKPLSIPRKVQLSLPYRDKPKLGPRQSKRGIERVAVARSIKDQEVFNLLNMVKTAYKSKEKQAQIETKERVQKHNREISEINAFKDKKIKMKKKEVMRQRSKSQLARQAMQTNKD